MAVRLTRCLTRFILKVLLVEKGYEGMLPLEWWHHRISEGQQDAFRDKFGNSERQATSGRREIAGSPGYQAHAYVHTPPRYKMRGTPRAHHIN